MVKLFGIYANCYENNWVKYEGGEDVGRERMRVEGVTVPCLDSLEYVHNYCERTGQSTRNGENVPRGGTRVKEVSWLDCLECVHGYLEKNRVKYKR